MATLKQTKKMDDKQLKQLLRKIKRQVEVEGERKQGVVSELRKFAAELDEKQRSMDIAKVSFASSGVLGSCLTIAGIAAAPFTFGASLGLTIAGVTVGVTSGLGGLATSIADMVINGNTLKEAQTKVDEYQESVDILVDLLRNLETSDAENLQKLITEEFSDMDRTKQNVFEAILNGVKTGTEVIGSTGRSVAVATAMAARIGSATGKTMLQTLETGMKTVKIGGAVLSVLTVPIDLYTMVSSSIKIHKKTPSTTAEEIRNIAVRLEHYHLLPEAPPGRDAARDRHGQEDVEEENKENNPIKRLVENISVDLAELEHTEQQRKVKHHMKRLIDKTPVELAELAARYDQYHRPACFIKCLCLLMQTVGTSLATAGAATALLEWKDYHVGEYGVTLVITCGVMLLLLEMYLELSSSSIWKDAELVLERYFHTIQVLTDLDEAVEDHRTYVEDTFTSLRDNLHRGTYSRETRWDMGLLACKLLVDTLALVFFGRRVSDSAESADKFGLVLLDTSVAVMAYPLGFVISMRVSEWVVLVHMLTLPMSAYLLLIRLEELRGKARSKVSEAIHNLAEDFCKNMSPLEDADDDQWTLIL